ncbi:hypothetical protein HDU93_008564 [Gonapodya sp. JEL0774]|nr:hypothetical protein HDU93_008564 [Gonapodya sp. JEL0774]
MDPTNESSDGSLGDGSNGPLDDEGSGKGRALSNPRNKACDVCSARKKRCDLTPGQKCVRCTVAAGGLSSGQSTSPSPRKKKRNDIKESKSPPPASAHVSPTSSPDSIVSPLGLGYFPPAAHGVGVDSSHDNRVVQVGQEGIGNPYWGSYGGIMDSQTGTASTRVHFNAVGASPTSSPFPQPLPWSPSHHQIAGFFAGTFDPQAYWAATAFASLPPTNPAVSAQPPYLTALQLQHSGELQWAPSFTTPPIATSAVGAATYFTTSAPVSSSNFLHNGASTYSTITPPVSSSLFPRNAMFNAMATHTPILQPGNAAAGNTTSLLSGVPTGTAAHSSNLVIADSNGTAAYFRNEWMTSVVLNRPAFNAPTSSPRAIIPSPPYTPVRGFSGLPDAQQSSRAMSDLHTASPFALIRPSQPTTNHDTLARQLASPTKFPFSRLGVEPPSEYAKLRESPLTQVEFWDGSKVWLATTFRDVENVLGNDLFSKIRSEESFPELNPGGRLATRSRNPTFMDMDPPAHSKQRAMVEGWFTPQRVEKIREDKALDP